jgi:hypothetical protein
MALFTKIPFLNFNKKSKIAFLPTPVQPVVATTNTLKCSTIPYKTLASFDLKVESPRYEGAIPDATIKFYPID